MRKLIILAAGFMGYVVPLNAQNTFPQDGNVGIGTTSPVSKLDVRGGNVNVGAAGDDRYVNVFGTWRTQSTANGLWDQKMVGENLAFHHHTGSSWLTNRLLVTANGISSNGNLTIYGSGNNSLSGSLGIGETSPASLLHLSGTNTTITINATVGANGIQTRSNGVKTMDVKYDPAIDQMFIYGYKPNSIFSVYTSASERFRITSDGNVGIGTIDPGTYKLKVQGTAHINGPLISGVTDYSINSPTYQLTNQVMWMV